MFKKIKTTILFVVLLLALFSCAHCNNQQHPKVYEVLPRKAFVHLEKSLLVKSCNKNQCISMNFRSSASGYVVNKQSDGAFIVTAAHFCENSLAVPTEDFAMSARFKARTLDGTEFDSVLLHYQKDIDACLLFSKGMTDEIEVVNISPVGPKPGEKIFNIGAPASIVGPNMVPILEGRFNGNLGINAFYTLPAAPGSSGSMILNERGELIGMVHSVYLRFNVMSLSTKYEDLKEFIEKSLYKYLLYKSVMNSLELDNIFIADN